MTSLESKQDKETGCLPGDFSGLSHPSKIWFKLKEQGKTHRCNKCRKWFAREEFPGTKHLERHICTTCKGRKGLRKCNLCGNEKPESEFPASRWASWKGDIGDLGKNSHREEEPSAISARSPRCGQCTVEKKREADES